MTFPRNQILALLLIVSLFQNNSLVHAAASFLNHSNVNVNVNVNANINVAHSRPLNRIGDGIQSLLPLGISSSSRFLRLGGGRRKHKHNHHGHNGALFAMGDIISGITGQAPKSLEPPLEELLKDTNLDPELSRVDLQCVYKASRYVCICGMCVRVRCWYHSMKLCSLYMTGIYTVSIFSLSL
jgi:hypothetical protein